MPGQHREGYHRERRAVERRVLTLLRRHCPDLCQRLFAEARADIDKERG